MKFYKMLNSGVPTWHILIRKHKVKHQSTKNTEFDKQMQDTLGFDNYHKIAIHDHVLVPKFWRT